ncbi:hypothetical protein INT43_004123 [Umbelopsis isabellina]|uniref:UDENN domain-containing protein n=1 Tax=Mortierella isabellina TaxID=91625 RepID=A0A8H7PHS9_MORIS|nr:hypothetical protein INT43_004123 [Umbelopsis isabellina]
MTDQEPRRSLDQNKDAQIAAVLVVGFHHSYGPILEFCHPPLPQRESKDQQTALEKLELPEEWSFLPFLALPDGAHQQDEDFSYFHLPPVAGWSVAETTLFGISCNRQIASKDLTVKSADVTRSIVQKAVVVLARQPIFGPIRQKLAVITAAWFNQKDFSKIDILYNFYDNLNSTHLGPIDDPTLYMGTSLRELLQKFRSKTLTLVKLLLLEKKILFYGYPVERLCTFQYSLISLIPGLLRSLQDSGDPALDTSTERLEMTEAKVLSNGDKSSLFRYMGLPLNLFEKGSFFQPYLPLQQIDMLSHKDTRAYLVGTTNQLFFHHKTEINIDVLVHVDNGTLEFFDPNLASIVSHTMADRRWMDKLTKVVNNTWDAADPTRPIQNTYLGSDDYLRARFEEYIMSLLSSVKYAEAFDPKNAFKSENSLEDVIRDEEKEKNYLLDYGMHWVNAWRQTNNFELWDQYTDHEIYEIVEPGHPGQGTSALGDLQNSLTNRIRDMRIRQNLSPIRQSFTKAVSAGGSNLTRAVSSGGIKLMRGVDALWNEFEKGVLDETEEGRTPEVSNSQESTSALSENAGARRGGYPPSQVNKSPTSESIPDISPFIESTTQQAGRLFTNVSSFLSRKQKEISKAMEESMAQSRQLAELRGQQRGEVGRAQPRQKTSMGSSTNAPATYPPPQKPSQDARLVANSKPTETIGPEAVEDNPQKNPDVDDIQEI